jgi:hypothetical protein
LTNQLASIDGAYLPLVKPLMDFAMQEFGSHSRLVVVATMYNKNHAFSLSNLDVVHFDIYAFYSTFSGVLDDHAVVSTIKTCRDGHSSASFQTKLIFDTSLCFHLVQLHWE